MAETLDTLTEIHERVMNYAVCDPSMVTIEEDIDELTLVVKVPSDKLLIELDELQSIIKAGIPPATAVDVEASS